MFELLPLLKGWKYDIKAISEPKWTTAKVIPIIDKADTQGWIVSTEVISNDKDLVLKLYLNNHLIMKNTTKGFYTGGSRLLPGVPNTFLYRQYIAGTNIPLYGLSIYVPSGYPYNESVRVECETTQSELLLASYQVVIVEIYDPEAFKESLINLNTIQSDRGV